MPTGKTAKQPAAGEEGLSPQQKAAAARKRNLEAAKKAGGGGEAQNRQQVNAAIQREARLLTTMLQEFGGVNNRDTEVRVMRYICHSRNITPQMLFPELELRQWTQGQPGEGGTLGAAAQQTQQGRSVTTGT